MTTDNEQLQSRGEFYLCLARAFLTPGDDESWRGLRDALADDLDELGEELDLAIGPLLADYRAAIAAVPDRAGLLQIYSSLFLAPPRAVGLNTGSYLDGAMNGGSVLAMEAAYRSGGLERSGDFRDLADHLSLQLEFVASRYLARLGWIDAIAADGDAECFLGRFVAPALPAFVADLERAGVQPNPWLPLARVLQAAVVRDARAPQQEVAVARQQAAIDKARHARALHGIDAEDLAFISRRLSEKGLATDHLSVAPELRDEAHGWSRRVPPSPRRGSRCG
ncbi:MAG TPA: molecular chaperone TorD family protein [Azospira sp.]|nr:molecular chaperone TorD family protein [Azospira sp.]